MPSDFLVESQIIGNAITVVPIGELDLVSSPIFAQALERARESGAELIVVDLRRLEFMDSTGLHVLITAQQRAIQSGRRFGAVKGTPPIQRVFDLTGTAELLTIVDAPEELLEVDQTP
jgi:anti-sigma B factor antagonist